ncbi:MAG TPA: glycerol-3-phosphate dehydrogenase/oxidase [Candidatus Binatia bacterium]
MSRGGVELLVIGGGITGAGIARDAAMRGLRTALIERGDFASGTSSRSSKLIHGGLRYLEQGEVGLVLEAAQERRRLRQMAPHLAVAARMALPVFGRTSAGLMKLRAGLWAYEKMARIDAEERHEIWRRDETLDHIRGLDANRLQGAAVYTEYITDDARLTLETVKSAKRAGALVASYAPAIALAEAPGHTVTSGNASSAGRALRVTVNDEIAGRELVVEARVVVNASGPWVDAVRRLGGDVAPRMHLTKGIHLVVSRERLPVDDIVVMRALDRRMVFVVPYGDILWIGTTDTDYPRAVERPTITREDVDYLLEATNRTWPQARITHEDVRGAWAGVRPLLHQEGKKPSEISRRDEIIIEPNGLLSIAGGKLTTYRRMAERVVDAVVERLGSKAAGPCRTADVPLVEGETPVPIVRTTLSDAEVEHAIDAECALSVCDVLERRARANLFAPGNGLADVERVAAILARRLGWDERRQATEIEHYRARVAEDVAWRSERGAGQRA